MSKTLVIGASGTVGSALVPLLAARGQDVVSATSRPVTGRGEVHLNLLTGEGLADAFEGVSAAYLLSPPGHVNQDELLGRLIEEARVRRIGKVVLMSAMGANADPNGPLCKAELQLKESGLAWNVIRPNWFMQNFNTYWLQGIQEHSAILLPAGAAKGSFIDARDIAAVAAELLLTSTFEGHDFDLTGAEALDHDQAAAILSDATGRTIGYQQITSEQMLEGLLAAGLPRPYAEFLDVILGYFEAGYAERTTDAVATITGHAPRTFAGYAKDYRSAWV